MLFAEDLAGVGALTAVIGVATLLISGPLSRWLPLSRRLPGVMGTSRAAELFDLITDPALHSVIDGSATVRGDPKGPGRLCPEATFSMAMQQARWWSYRSTNHVVEFVQDRLITWESTGTWRGHTVVGGQRWRWQLIPHTRGTLVRHSYVWGYARCPLITIRLPGYPARARRTLPRSLSRLGRLAADRRPDQ